MQEQLRQITKFRNEQGLLSNKLGQLLVDNNTLTDKLTSLQSMERDLTERWKKIQSPFGSVPIELKQLVALFPLSLAVGFLVCSYLITDAIKLRRAIHYSYQTRNTNASVVTDLKIGYIAPLWIDPSNPEKNNLGRFVILSVPLIIFIFSLIMTSYVWYYAPTVFSQLEKLVYSGLYAISIGFFVYGYLLIKKELDYYSNKLPKSSKFVVSEVIEGNLRNLVIDRKVSLEQAESLFEKLSDYRKLFNSGDFSKANERIDELIEETMQIAKMLEVEDRLKTLIVEAKKLRIDYPQDKRKANILG